MASASSGWSPPSQHPLPIPQTPYQTLKEYDALNLTTGRTKWWIIWTHQEYSTWTYIAATTIQPPVIMTTQLPYHFNALQFTSASNTKHAAVDPVKMTLRCPPWCIIRTQCVHGTGVYAGKPMKTTAESHAIMTQWPQHDDILQTTLHSANDTAYPTSPPHKYSVKQYKVSRCLRLLNLCNRSMLFSYFTSLIWFTSKLSQLNLVFTSDY